MMRDITLQLPSGAETTVPFGIKASTVLSKYSNLLKESISYQDNPLVGVLANNELLSLNAPMEINAVIEPVYMFSEYGKRMYRHTLCFILAMASTRVFPDRRLVIGHSLGDGYYYQYDDDLPVTPADAVSLEQEIEEISLTNYPIRNLIYSYVDALSFFEKKGIADTAELLSFQNDPRIPLFECDGFLDLAYEPLLPHTSLIDVFEVKPYGSGILLRYPRQSDLTKLGDFEDNPVLFSVYQEYKQWGSIVSVNCVGQLNRLCDARTIGDYVKVAEAFQDKKISRIADDIAKHKGSVHTVLIAGPSSSGKTTFTKKLGIQLKVLGFEPIEISLDNYYNHPSFAPKDEFGKPNLEAMEALDVDKINEDLLALFRGEAVELINYDFITKARVQTGRFLRLNTNSIILMEGIHGLNPGLTRHIPDEQKYHIYISALTQLNLDDHNRISTTDNRMIRRIVRDHQFRGMPAKRTLEMWPSVHRGEKINIFPYQNNADTAFNSALDYELAALKVFAQPLLKSVKPADAVYTEAQRLLAFLENFYQIPSNIIPKHSIIREFIGGSGFSY
ncbi:MAG: nucleoside kinase [Spirochaetales bacterium]|jgi:uridine kinase|nr:nucleoside kinase [Spirochaetales bacterium]